MSTTETITISCLIYCNNPAFCGEVIVACAPRSIDIPSNATTITIDRSTATFPRFLSFNAFKRIGNRNFYILVDNVSRGASLTLSLNDLNFERQDAEKLEILQAIDEFEARFISISGYINSYASGCSADTICERETARIRFLQDSTLLKEYIVNVRAIIVSSRIVARATHWPPGNSRRFTIPEILRDKIDRIIVRKGFCDEYADIKLYIKLIYTDNSSEYFIIDEQHDTAITVRKPLSAYAILSSVSTATIGIRSCYIADIMLVPKPF
jgi:hypothetical protein